jgi:hypothetical protein
MTDQRRYREDEVEEIFEEAAKARESGGPSLTPADGLTLEELQAIGSEVGLSPDRIAEAASVVDLRRGASPRRTSLGMPISVDRVVELPRAPTDREWDLLVSELRQTFKAKGTLGGSGTVRHWHNGNLHAYVEPTETGHHLRLGTLKGNANPLNMVGLMGVGMALLLTVVFVLTGHGGDDLVVPIMFGGMGIGALATNAIGLPRWAREREEQMEHLATRARALLDTKEEG